MKHMKFYIFKSILINYRPQRSCGQGNVFTGVCLSKGGRVHAGMPDPPSGPGRPPCDQADTPWDQADTPPDQAGLPLGPGRPPRDQADHPHLPPPPTSLDQTDPPGKQTPAYGLRAAGTHPTGMHSCFLLYIAFSNKNTIINCQLKVLGLNQPVPRNVLSKFF